MKPAELLQKTLGGFLWMTGSTLAVSLLRVVFVSVLARILTPAEFGLMATGMLIVKFSELIAQMGVGPALVQKEDLTDTHINVGFTITLTFGVALCGLFLILNPVIARFFKMEELKGVLDILCLAIPIRMIAQVAYSILQRNMEFKRLGSIDVFSYFVGYGLFGILFAKMGLGVMSLVYAVLIQSVLNSVVLMIQSTQKIRIQFSKTHAKDLLSFGFGFTLSTVFNFFARNGDTIIVSRYLGAAQVGIYDRAYVLMNVTNNIVGKAIGTVMFPAFSKLQSQKEKRDDLFVRSLSMSFGVLMPVVPFTYVFADEIVFVLLGDQWASTVPPFQILCFFLVFRVVYKVCGSFLKGVGLVFVNSIFQFMYMIMILLGSYLVYDKGVEGVAVVVGIALTINFLAQLIYIEVKNRGLIKKIGFCFLRSIPLFAAMFGGLYLFKSLLSESDISSLFMLLGGALTFVMVVVLLWLLIGAKAFNPDVVKTYSKIRSMKNRGDY